MWRYSEPSPKRGDSLDSEMRGPDMLSSHILNPLMRNSDMLNADMLNSYMRSPGVPNHDMLNPYMRHADMHTTGMHISDLRNPDIRDPGVRNPDTRIAQPEFAKRPSLDLHNADLSRLHMRNHHVTPLRGRHPSIRWVQTTDGGRGKSPENRH